jgi:hypothetical protein
MAAWALPVTIIASSSVCMSQNLMDDQKSEDFTFSVCLVSEKLKLECLMLGCIQHESISRIHHAHMVAIDR